MKSRRDKKELLSRPFTPSDEWAAGVRRECAKAIVVWLKSSLNLDRSIRSLTLPEVENIAEAATSTWIVHASKRIDVPEPTLSDDQITAMLM